MYGENTKYHSNPYIQGTTVPCDNLLVNNVVLIPQWKVLVANTLTAVLACMKVGIEIVYIIFW